MNNRFRSATGFKHSRLAEAGGCPGELFFSAAVTQELPFRLYRCVILKGSNGHWRIFSLAQLARIFSILKFPSGWINFVLQRVQLHRTAWQNFNKP